MRKRESIGGKRRAIASRLSTCSRGAPPSLHTVTDDSAASPGSPARSALPGSASTRVQHVSRGGAGQPPPPGIGSRSTQWWQEKTLSGSYLRLTPCSRVYVASPHSTACQSLSR